MRTLIAILVLSLPLIPITIIGIMRVRQARSSHLPRVFAWGMGFARASDWRLWLSHEWYDGPFWQLVIGPFYCVWSLDGLPSIFQEKNR